MRGQTKVNVPSAETARWTVTPCCTGRRQAHPLETLCPPVPGQPDEPPVLVKPLRPFLPCCLNGQLLWPVATCCRPGFRPSSSLLPMGFSLHVCITSHSVTTNASLPALAFPLSFRRLKVHKATPKRPRSLSAGDASFSVGGTTISTINQGAHLSGILHFPSWGSTKCESPRMAVALLSEGLPPSVSAEDASR